MHAGGSRGGGKGDDEERQGEGRRGKCKSVAGGGRREEGFFSPSLGFINGAAPELCGSERVRQPWKEEEGRERKREREISKMADASERKGSHVVMDEIRGASAGEGKNG